jgi:hypothetical protein
MYSEDESDNWSEAKREEWQKQREADKAARLEKFSHGLNPIERDREIRKILSQLDLTKADRGVIAKRNYVPIDFIENCRSVEKWQKLEQSVNPRLAGVNGDGSKLANFTDGILIPIPDKDGLFVGLRVHNSNHATNEDPKYYPLSSEAKPWHLNNGEQPLAVYWGDAPQNIICFAEGLEYKPAIAAKQLNCVVIGASGGNFASSPKLLAEAVAKIETALGPCQKVLAPDAGSRVNKNVLGQYRKLKGLVNLDAVLDWGQWDSKENLDLDELSNLDLITYQKPVEFFGAEKTEHQKKLEEIQRQLTSLTANLTIDSPRLPSLIDFLNGDLEQMLFIRSAKGTGKTYQSKELIDILKSLDYEIIYLTSRVSLGRAAAKSYNLNYIDDDADLEKGNIALCVNSIAKIRTRIEGIAAAGKHTALILDEFELFCSHLFNGTIDDKPQVFKLLRLLFEEIAAAGGFILGMDADLTDTSVNYARALASGYPCRVVNNLATPNGYKAYIHDNKDEVLDRLYTCLENNKRVVISTDSKEDAEGLIRLILERFPAKKAVTLHSDNSGEDWAQELLSHSTAWLKSEQPDIFTYTPSMGTGASIDEEGLFDECFSFHFGIVEANQVRQSLIRYRDTSKPRYCWISSHGNYKTPLPYGDPVAIKKATFDNLTDGLNLSEFLFSIEDDREFVAEHLDTLRSLDNLQVDNAHLDLFCKLEARKYNEKYNYRQTVVDGLKAEKCQVEVIKSDILSTNLVRELRTVKTELRREKAKRIAAAQLLPIERAEILKKSPRLTQKEQEEVTKTFLEEEFPGVGLSDDPKFICEEILQGKRKNIRTQKLLYALKHPEETKHREQLRFKQRVKRFRKGDITAWDIPITGAQIKLLEDVKILDLISYGKVSAQDTPRFTKDSPEVQTFAKQCYFWRRRFKRLFGINITAKLRDCPIQLLQMILGLISLKLVCTRSGKGARERVYYFNPQDPSADKGASLPTRERIEEALKNKAKRAEEREQKAKQIKLLDYPNPPKKDHISNGIDGQVERFYDTA